MTETILKTTSSTNAIFSIMLYILFLFINCINNKYDKYDVYIFVNVNMYVAQTFLIFSHLFFTSIIERCISYHSQLIYKGWFGIE